MSRKHEKYRTHHASRRLRGYDYTRPAAYFITICAHERWCLFGAIRGGTMRLNEAGRAVAEEWHRSEAMRVEIALDVFVVMPNHVHGIVVIAAPEADAPTDPRGYDLRAYNADVAPTGRSALPEDPTFQPGPPPKSLGSFVAGFKAAVTKRINRKRGTPGQPVWQRNYYDRILRDEGEWRGARCYIQRNPAQWTDDRNHPTQL